MSKSDQTRAPVRAILEVRLSVPRLKGRKLSELMSASSGAVGTELLALSRLDCVASRFEGAPIAPLTGLPESVIDLHPETHSNALHQKHEARREAVCR